MNERILIVDDQPLVLTAIARFLEGKRLRGAHRCEWRVGDGCGGTGVS